MASAKKDPCSCCKTVKTHNYYSHLVLTYNKISEICQTKKTFNMWANTITVKLKLEAIDTWEISTLPSKTCLEYMANVTAHRAQYVRWLLAVWHTNKNDSKLIKCIHLQKGHLKWEIKHLMIRYVNTTKHFLIEITILGDIESSDNPLRINWTVEYKICPRLFKKQTLPYLHILIMLP